MNTQQPPRVPRTFGEVEHNSITPPPVEQAGEKAMGDRAAVSGKRPGPTAADDFPIQLKIRMSEHSAAIIKGAYVASVDIDPDPSPSFADWIARVVDEHARRTPQRRAQLARGLEHEAISRTDSQNRGFKIPTSTWQLIDQACSADRKAGRPHGRTSFGQEAVAVAVEGIKAAKQRAGEQLVPFYGRLPRKLV